MPAERHAAGAPTLAQLQSRLAGALLAEHAADQALPPAWITGRVPASDALHAHRNTVLGALSHALRISYPAIDRLVGEAFFDRMAVAYSRMNPPREPQLASHGAGFAQFAAGFPGVQGLPFLAELAQFEWLLDELGRSRAQQADSQDALDVGGGLRLRFAPTLRVLATRYPVADLREALLADDAARVAALAATPGEHAQALWRGEQGVRVRALHPAAARCLELLRAGDPLQRALESARGAMDGAAFMDIIRADLLEAGFSTLTESAS
ncbi:MAG: hypothetical protein RL684_2034 [Pseudomonadota bacterium]|jgi:hypothetical protein